MLRELPEKSVQCVVTSPPYWGLRNYGTEPQPWPSLDDSDRWYGEFGSEPTPELYVEHTILVLREIRRVLRDDGTVWWNIGDSYASKPVGRYNGETTYIPGRDLSARLRSGSMDKTKATGLPEKNLVGIPWRVAFAAQADGWILRDDIIWAKKNCMPESTRDRPTRSHEDIFLFVKRGRYFYDQDGYRQPYEESSLAWVAQPTFWDQVGGEKDFGNGTNPNRSARRSLESVAKRMGYAPSTLREVEDGYDGSATKPYDGTGAQDPSAVKKRIIEGLRKKQDLAGNATYEGFNDRWSLNPFPNGGANLRDVWWLPTQPYPDAHFATFPSAIPERAILLGTSERGACPKCGTPAVRVVDREVLDPRPTVPDAEYREATGSHSGSQSPSDFFAQATSTTRTTAGFVKGCECSSYSEKFEPVPCLVLDPFAGSGTTLAVARQLGRRSIGIDLNPKYADLIENRPEVSQPSLEDEW